ncbi:MAG: hypothetical protein JSR45_08505 [Proteobacteria bacterium]|nr:hypothetical protein [Pseudomonadota bacterium]
MNTRTRYDASMPLDAEELAWRQLSQGLQDLARKPAVDLVRAPITASLHEALESLAPGATAH